MRKLWLFQWRAVVPLDLAVVPLELAVVPLALEVVPLELAVVPLQDFSTVILAVVLRRTFCEDFLGGGCPGSIFALPWAQR